jgi:hypothetical protein
MYADGLFMGLSQIVLSIHGLLRRLGYSSRSVGKSTIHTTGLALPDLAHFAIEDTHITSFRFALAIGCGGEECAKHLSLIRAQNYEAII